VDGKEGQVARPSRLVLLSLFFKSRAMGKAAVEAGLRIREDLSIFAA